MVTIYNHTFRVKYYRKLSGGKYDERKNINRKANSSICRISQKRGKSENTIEKYVRDVRAFAAYAGNAEITKESVIAYKNKLLSEGYAVRSINSMLASINSLFAFLGRENLKVKSLKLQRQIYCPEEKELTKA